MFITLEGSKSSSGCSENKDPENGRKIGVHLKQT